MPPDPLASVTNFLSTSALKRNELPENQDSTFKAHISLLRKTTLHNFDLNRYLFVYKPLAKVNCILGVQLLNVIELENRNFTISPMLRSAAMYVACNAQRSVFGMILSGELKNAFKLRPATENIIPEIVLSGDGLNEQEIASIDFVQEISSDFSHICEDTKRRVIDGSVESNGQLERILAGLAAYAAFLSKLSSIIDFEITYESIQYATNNLQGLPWKPSGGHFLIENLQNDVDDPFSLDSVSGSARQRLMKVRRSARVNNNRNIGGSGKYDRRSSLGHNTNRLSNFFTNSITAPRLLSEVSKASENWMKSALLPPPGQIFEINDLLMKMFGFEPFYFSTTIMVCENMRRSFILSAKEMLFQEKEVSKRTKLLVCYVLAKGAEKAREAAMSKQTKSENCHGRARIRSMLSAGNYTGNDYDGLALMSAHAAFLACKNGATPAELIAASDISVITAAVERATARDTEGAVTPDGEEGVLLSKRDVAAAALAHAMAAKPARIDASLLRTFEDAFGSPLKRNARGGRICHRALLEVVGAACMWAALEKFACAALSFDIDMTSNMMFANGRAEPTITDFANSPVGKDIGLSLLTEEISDPKARRESKLGRMSSLMRGGGLSSPSRSPYKKRTSSSPTTPARVARMLSGPNGSGSTQ